MNEIVKCNNCGWIGTENDLAIKTIDFEEEYGVGPDFANHHYTDVECCPSCGEANDLDKMSIPQYEDEQWLQIIEDATDVTRLINGLYVNAVQTHNKELQEKVEIISRKFTNMKGDLEI